MSEGGKHKIKSFKFGNGKIATSEKCISIPRKIAGERVNVVTDVAKSEIPLLFSKENIKKAGTKIGFVNDKVIIFGKEISLQFTSSGHYAIPLNDCHKDLKLPID